MSFINVQMWWLFPLIVLIALWAAFHAAQRRRAALSGWLGADPARHGEHIRLSPARRGWRRFFWLAGVFFLILAAARPWWEYSLVNAESRGRDLLVVFDVSKSMNATDVAPSRLEHGKWLLRQLIQAHRHDRFGLLPFAGRALLTCPLTDDVGALEQYLSELDTDAIPIGGTNLGEALQVALRAFQAAEGQDRAIVLFTDGEELTGDATVPLEELKKRHIPLFIVGLGSPDTGALIPETGPDGRAGFKRDASGELVKTKLNEPLLQALAAQTGGVYVRSTSLDSGLAALNQRITALAPEGRGTVSEKLPIERFMPFLAVGLGCLIVYWLMGERGRKRALVLWFGVCCGVLFGATPEEATPENAPPPPPESALESYNRGVAAQEQGELPTAQAAYESAISQGAAAPDVRQRAWHNYGILDHTKAREALAQAEQTVRQGQLDGALKQLDGAEKQLKRAEEFYVNALATPAPAAADTMIAQNTLLADREQITELRKKIEELQEQQKQAQEQTQQAQQENQEKQDQQQQQGQQDQQQQQQGQQDQQQQQQGQQDQQQQGQQDQQQQGQQDQQQQQGQQDQQQQQQGQQDQQQQQGQQDQQQQQGQQDQQQQGQQGQEGQPDQQQQGQSGQSGAQEQPSKAEQAAAAAEKLEQMAKDLQQQSLAEQAKKAAEELKQAADKQQQGDYSGAEENIEAARQALNAAGQAAGEPQSGEQPQSGEPQSGGQESGEAESQQSEAETESEAAEAAEAEAEAGEQAEQEIDEAQANALLEMLTQDEVQMREQMRQRQQRRLAPVKQDW